MGNSSLKMYWLNYMEVLTYIGMSVQNKKVQC